jgi:hypothetical protein
VSAELIFGLGESSRETALLTSMLVPRSGRSNISSKYTISESSSVPSSNAGLWRIQRGVRGTGGGALSTITGGTIGQGPSTPDGTAEDSSTNAAANAAGTNERSVVSIWSHSLNARTKDRTLIVEVLKKEVRHSSCDICDFLFGLNLIVVLYHLTLSRLQP